MMNRRAFLLTSAAGVAAAAVAGHRLLAEGQTGDGVSRSLDGKTYEATVPDTLDLAERARLALNGLGGNIDTELMTMFGQIIFCAPRPHFCHWGSAETLCDPKFAESFPLMRLMSGSDQYANLERAFRKAILSRVDEGLYWDRVNPRRPWRNSYSAWLYGKGKDEDFCTVVGAGRLLRALLVWRELGDGTDCDRLLDELCRGLRRILVVKGNYGYYPAKGGWGEACAYPRSGWLNQDDAKSDTEGGEGSIVGMHGHQLYGAARWYEQSGSKVALDLATKLANYCMLPKFWGGVADPKGDRKGLPGHIAPRQPDPLFTSGSELGHWYSHFHCRAIALRGLLAYGRATADPRAIEFVRRAYEFTLSQGIARMGWINCYPGAMNLMEGCALGDLVGLAVQLSDMGAGDYWDDVDAVVRNHLAEQQFTRKDLLAKVVEQFKNLPDMTSKRASGEVCFDKVIERSIGSFAVLSLPNMIPHPMGTQCCTGNATQGLFYAWEGTLRENTNRATVNLFLNRAGRLLDVDSCLPYEGKVVLRNKKARNIAVRIPSWVDKQELGFGSVKLSAEPYWLGRYLMFDGPQAGAEMTLTFPVRTQTSTYTVNAGAPQQMPYTCEFRGSTLIQITPENKAPSGIPLYQRSAMRASTTPFHKVRRFVAARTVRGWLRKSADRIDNKPFLTHGCTLDCNYDMGAQRREAIFIRSLGPGIVPYTFHGMWPTSAPDSEVAMHMASYSLLTVPVVCKDLSSLPAGQLEVVRAWLRFYQEHAEDTVYSDVEPLVFLPPSAAFRIERNHKAFVGCFETLPGTIPLTANPSEIYLFNGIAKDFFARLTGVEGPFQRQWLDHRLQPCGAPFQVAAQNGEMILKSDCPVLPRLLRLTKD